MSLGRFFDWHRVAGKAVYVVDDHHKALAAWALTRRKLAAAPYLLTIDHHTDTDDAFAGHVSLTTYDNPSIDGQAWPRNCWMRLTGSVKTASLMRLPS